MAFTKEQKQKLKKKSYRMKKLYKIKTKNAEQIIFKRNEAQEHFNKNKHTRNVILKSRQLGFTTDEVIDGLDDCLTTPNFNMLMISFDMDSARDIFDEKVRLAWETLHPEFSELYGLDMNRANTLKFDLGKGYFSSFKVRTKGRSGTYQRVHVSEFGKICKESPNKAKEIMTGVIPAVPTSGRIDFESTAEGEEGYFHDMFWEAWLRGDPKHPKEYKAHFYNWQWDHAEIEASKPILPISEMDQSAKFAAYQKLHNLTDLEMTYYYYQWITLKKDWKLLQQEFPTTPEEAFVSRGDKLFDQERIKAMMAEAEKHKREQVGDMWIYEEYNKGHRYAIGADVAEGLGLDSSTAVIMDFSYLKPKVVAIYKSNTIDPDLFGIELAAMGRQYGFPLLAPENNNMGIATIFALKKHYNQDLIFSMRAIGERDKELSTEEKTSNKLGWNTNSATKPKMFFDLNSAINLDLIDIPCKFLLHELRLYSKDKLQRVKYDPDATNHFDLITALAIVWQMKDHVIDQKNYQMTQTGGVEPFNEELGY